MKASRALTNAEIGTVIDGLRVAEIDLSGLIESSLPGKRKDWEPDDRQMFENLNGRIRSFRQLRRKLLRWEKGS